MHLNRVKPVTLELCIESADDADTAEFAGAHRVELNSALVLGGLTPSPGLVAATQAVCKLPIVAMLRPRRAGFCYSPREFEAMLNDLIWLLEENVAGVAFGFLTESGEINVELCRLLMKWFGRRDAVFHRAFDVVPDPFAALEILIDLGFKRILTSGQQPTALEGAPLIRDLIERAAGRIEILPAGGITADTVLQVIEQTGCDQVHGSFRSVRVDNSTRHRPQIRFSAANVPSEGEYTQTDARRVDDVLRLINERKTP